MPLTAYPPSEFTDTSGAAEFLGPGFTLKGLEAMRTSSTGPRYYRVGRKIRYTYADLTAWMNANPSDGNP